MKRMIMVLAICSSLGACRTITKEAVQLSEMQGEQIQRNEAATMALIDLWETDWRLNINEKMRLIVAPAFIIKTMKRIDFTKKVCDEKDESKKGAAMEVITRKLTQRLQAERAVYISALENQAAKMRSGWREVYRMSRSMNDSLTATLRAHIKDKELKKAILRRVGLPTDPMESIRKANAKMNRMIESRSGEQGKKKQK